MKGTDFCAMVFREQNGDGGFAHLYFRLRRSRRILFAVESHVDSNLEDLLEGREQEGSCPGLSEVVL